MFNTCIWCCLTKNSNISIIVHVIIHLTVVQFYICICITVSSLVLGFALYHVIQCMPLFLP